MQKYLVKNSAAIGRSTDDGADHGPVYLTFYTVVEAKSVEDASDQVVQYSDPTFTTSVTDITELKKNVSASELSEMLSQSEVISEVPR